MADVTSPLIGTEVWGARELCRVPSADGPAWEAALSRGNAVAAADSLAALAVDLQPLPVLLAGGWGDPPEAVELAPDLLDRLDPGSVADELLSFHHLPGERLRTAGPSHTLDPVAALAVEHPGYGLHRPSPTAAAALLADGGAVAVTGIDDHAPALNRWMEHLDRVVGQTCRVDLVVTGAGTGLSAAADDAARLFVALDGAGRLEAIPAEGGPGPLRLPASLTLKPGSATWLPPGWGHRVVGSPATTAVLVVVVPRLTLRDVVLAAGSDAVFWPLLRADVPVEPSEPAVSYAGSVFDTAEGLTEAALAALDDAALDRAVARNRGRLPGRWAASLTTTVAALSSPSAALEVRCPFPGGLQAGPTQADGTVVVYGGGHKLRVTVEVAEALGTLADGRSHRAEDVAHLAPGHAEAPHRWAEALIAELLALPLVEVAP